MNRHGPVRKLNKKEIKLKSKLWITAYILRKIKHRNDLFSQKKNNLNDEYQKSAYNKFRNSVHRDIEKSEKRQHI